MNARHTLCILALGGLPLFTACNDRQAADPTTAAPATEPAAEAKVADGVLGSRVKAALAADGRINAGAISVAVANGQVTLDGIVPADQITRADAVARSVAGVVEVINALEPALPGS